MHYVDKTGKYLGYFDGKAPSDATALDVAPETATDLWNGTEWTKNPNADAPSLTSAQFEWLLAYTGFADLWEALEKAAKGEDRVRYAALKAERANTEFRLKRALAVVATFRPIAAQIMPEIDLSDDAIKAAWMQAADFKGIGK